MATPITWALYDNSGAPLLGATPTFIDFCNRSGISLPAPIIQEYGSGLYGFIPTDAQELIGACYLVDNGPNASQARFSGSIKTPANPFSVWHLEDGSGALWSGAPPTIPSGGYRSPTGPLIAPAIQVVRPYLFSLTPLPAQALLGIIFLSNSPSGALPEFVQDGLKAIPIHAGPGNGNAPNVGTGASTTDLPNANLELNNFIQNVRTYLRDYPELNRLIAGEESSNRQIVWALADALDDFNTTPHFTQYQLQNFPSKSLLVRGTVITLLESIGLLQTRNYLQFSDGGIQVGVSDKTPFIQSWIQLLKNSYEEKKQRLKVAINIESAWGGGVSSEYRFINNFYGEW